MKALIIGITGQDGSYLSELLLDNNYDVYGVIRRASTNNLTRIDHIKNRIHLRYGDLTDTLSIYKIIAEIQPDEIYNFGAQSDVKASFDIPEYSADVNALGTLRVLEAVRQLNLKTKIYNACTSEMYGNPIVEKQNEETQFNPVSPYGISKLYSYYIAKRYREAYNMFIVNGICFNHESPRRGSEFVTKKIVHDLVHYGCVELGNIYAKRDWGYAKDYVYGMYLSLQHSIADDYVFATGETHSVKEFCDAVCKILNINIIWNDNTAMSNNRVVVSSNNKFKRPIDINYLCGDSTKAFNILGWKSQTSFDELVELMVNSERLLNE